ncbi:RIP metalloprotease RseP [Helicobacter cappadocius]|uniref:Zinc metalloprotease n=1 Tax=Helicobacter cappadocius TaxID=3063998 RepID=A0AA90PKU7_9HELI|nr:MULTISPECIES: RIP metalloprotease RseP [unclassified Helicobacter]MDO7252900.1 RIP metalloprotease RseP [Helicobacter sp. faydin-H75]MDP2538944.1 RIP metalloprotease RseP [Helicobacter sp. faydin-H76]
MWIILSLLILSFLVFFHELGHFLVAKLFGVSVEVFSIGFGKKIFKKTYKGTQYALSAIPLGGYVKLKGQDDTNPLATSDDIDSYSNKNHFQKIAILLAGPFFNFILAFLIYIVVALMGQKVILPIVGELQAGMPASISGLMSGDYIRYINGKEVKSWKELNMAIMDAKGEVKVIFQRDGVLKETSIIPKIMESKNIFGEKIQRNFIGIISKGEIGVVKYSFLSSLSYAYEQTFQASKMILQGVEKMISGIVPINQVGGVISIVDFISQASQSGWVVLLTLVALISVNLGVMNLLPIPALDGGQILFNLYEMVSRRKMSENSLYYLTILGWVLLIGLMALGVYNDIHRLVFHG